MKKLLIALFALFALAVPFAVNAQQGTRTIPNPIVITEDQINQSFRITNPASRRWTNLHVDVQSGQAVITGTLTLRAPAGQGTTSYEVSAVFTASVNNGRIFWTLASATANGEPASEQLITQINNSLMSSWRNYIRSTVRPGHVTSVTITDTDIQIAWQQGV